jgi:Fic family protein
MSSVETNIHILDAAYKPFPTFAEWASRTSVDTVRWDRYYAALNGRTDLSSATLKRAREIAKRFAALDTGAIEGLYEVDRGFTYTVAFETAAWEVELANKGENVRPLFEAQLHAYDYVLDLATKSEPISEAAIRVLHEEVCRAQTSYRVMTAVGPQEQALTRGRYKALSNHVRTRDGADHSYAPVDVTPEEMARLVNEMRSDSFLAAHSVIQAAYAHYCLVVIHPFADGNGRVARALASVFTYRAISMPIVILSEHKEPYLNALEDADHGDFQSFVDFMLARSLDTIQLVDESLRDAHMPTPEEGAKAINGLYVTKGGFTQDQVNESGMQLLKLFQNELTKIINRNTGPNLKGYTNLINGLQSTPDSSHRLPISQERGLLIRFNSTAPAEAMNNRQYVLFLPVDAGVNDDIQLSRADEPVKFVMDGTRRVGISPSDPAFSARMDELIPTISGVLQIRIAIFAERIVGIMLAELGSLADASLHGQKTDTNSW